MTMDVSPIAPPVYPVAPSPEAAASVSAQEMQQVPTTQTDPKTATVNAQQNQSQGNRNTRGTRQRSTQPVTEQNSNPHSYTFTYKEGLRVMKVFDHKSVLIYQVPPKGQLQILLQEHRAGALKTSA